MENLKPIKDFSLLDDPDQIASLAHRDRLAILRTLGEEPRTGADLARELGLPANRVHYHLNHLLERRLIEEVGKGRKLWKEERLFRSAARHYIVDPALGGDATAADAAIKASIEHAFLDWHREELLQIDLGRVARLMVERCLMVKPGEQVLVMHGPLGFDLAEHLHVELAAAGCLSHTRAWSPETIRATLERFSAEELARQPFLPAPLDDALAAVIFLSGSVAQGAPPSPEQMAKLPALMQCVSAWQQSLHARRVRYLEFALPLRREFDVQGSGPIRGATPEEAIEIFWKCIDTDYGRLARRAKALEALIAADGELRVTCPLGTDLRLRVDMERSFLLDGVVCPDDVAAGRSFEGLPAGTLNFFPVKGTAEGVYRADYTYQGGAHIESVFLTLREGRIVELKAERNEEVLKRRLESASGDADLLSGVRFGINPAGQGPTGKPILDACLAGAVTLHFGNNELQGGDVRSTIDLILPACHLTVDSGDTRLVDGGVLAAAARDV
ncbi:MAG: aminopeptidase [Candidatus Latescibacteria bacterium]|nr:aminopeptidase [Candidatus Latescibacterota bacterium]